MDIPEALGVEDGDKWYIRGHVDPALAYLAALVEVANHVGPEEAGDMLTCVIAPHQDHRRACIALGQLLDGVQHVYMRPDLDEERYTECSPWLYGAEQWTIVAI